jgi:hypothetical protein
VQIQVQNFFFLIQQATHLINHEAWQPIQKQ